MGQTGTLLTATRYYILTYGDWLPINQFLYALCAANQRCRVDTDLHNQSLYFLDYPLPSFDRAATPGRGSLGSSCLESLPAVTMTTLIRCFFILL